MRTPLVWLLAGVTLAVFAWETGAASLDLFGSSGVQHVTDKAAMPPFSLSTLEGQPVESKDLAGKVVLLNFWATWCGPCKEEMPALDRLRRQFNRDEFVMLAVTTDLRRDGIKDFLGSLGLAVPVLLDEDKDVSGAFMVRGLPTTVLIGKDGRVVGRAVGPRAWDSPQAVALVRSLIESSP